jgi:hypothetical protein
LALAEVSLRAGGRELIFCLHFGKFHFPGSSSTSSFFQHKGSKGQRDKENKPDPGFDPLTLRPFAMENVIYFSLSMKLACIFL